jgi:hypothetical protein
MGCRTILLSTLAVLLGAAWGQANAGVPDPGLSTVPNVITSPAHPNTNLDYVVTVVGADGPIDSALVQLVFSTEASNLVCWCTGQARPIVQAYSNASGVARFQIFGGGCLNPSTVVNPPVQVFANGVFLKQVGIVSVDPVDDTGKTPNQVGYNPAGSCKSALSDASFVTPSLKSGSYNFCTDFNTDLLVNLADAVIVTPAIKVGYVCTVGP